MRALVVFAVLLSAPLTGRAQPCASDADCDDMSECTVSTCDADTGRCVTTPILGGCCTDSECDDANACSVDECVDGGCSFAWIPDCCVTDGDCNDGDTCSVDLCDVTTNRCITDIPRECCLPGSCDDGDDCTRDWCDPPTGCFNERIEGCCRTDAECDDGDDCTADACQPDRRCAHDRVPGCGDAGMDFPPEMPLPPPDTGPRSMDAGTDAGPTDAGGVTVTYGCSCDVGPSAPATLGGLVLLVPALVLRVRRRRRRDS